MAKNKNYSRRGALAPDLLIDNLCLKYKHHLVFDNFKFRLPANQWTCLLGPSGVGKTSLLRFIAGLPYTKECKWNGYINTSNNKPFRCKISYMTQQDSLLPWLNILDNVLIGFVLRNITITNSLKQRAKILLQKAGLININKLRPDQLSHGMRQRVALVRSLMEDRQIVLMDEPFSALDVITKSKLQNLAAKLLKNRTVLLVTHDPLEALRLGNHIYIIAGSPAKISNITTPEGSIPRNLTNTNLLMQQAELLNILAKDSNILN